MIRTLGEGSEGNVYLAIRESVYRFYAVKVMKKTGQTFLRESMELRKRLSHPGLPEIVDVIETEEEVCLVMEYVEGKNVKELCEEKRLSMFGIISMGIGICEVLEYLHSQDPPVIYGDLKPENLILRKDRPVLVDLGSVLMQDSKGKRSGTKEYVPPWRDLETGDADVDMDLFALGKTLETLSDQTFYVPRGLKRIIERCKRQKEEGGFAHVRECRMELEKLQLRPWILICMCALALCVAAMAGKSLLREKHMADASAQYESFQEEAKETTGMEQRELLIRMIAWDPTCETGYLELLNHLLQDGVLSEEEDVCYRRVLKTMDENGRTHQERLKENLFGYAEVSYETGMAYWYFFEGQGGKRYAAAWFGNVGKVPEQIYGKKEKRIRSKIYERMGTYREKLEQQGRTGDQEVSYRTYWRDLTELLRIAGKDVENEKLRLYFFNELLLQMIHYAVEFQNDGVSVQEMKEAAELVLEKTEDVGKGSNSFVEEKQKIKELYHALEDIWERMKAE